MTKLLTAVFLLIEAFAMGSASAHTAIGSGGDVVAAYLEESRNRFVQSLQYLMVADRSI